jgi:L-alanine-DL-glutamate epimerase-like enolase superfamily enzyme
VKIVASSLHFYTLAYEREVVWANAVESAGQYALLRLEDESGAVGVAEGTIKSTWSGVSPRSLAAALEDVLLPRLIGVECAGPQGVLQRLAGIPENRLARALIDNAVWQIEAQRVGMPLWKLWGGEPGVDLTWAVTRRPAAQMAAEAAEVCSRYGFRTLKVKGGQGLETDLAAMREIRAAVGDAVEDPCALEPDAQFAALQAGAGIPVLVDRNCTSAQDAAQFLACGALALSTKPGRIGLSEARRIADLAATRGARVALGLYAESALGTLLSLQFGAALPRSRRLVAAEQTFYLCMREQVLADMPPVRDGRIELPAEPGLSQRVDWGRVQGAALRP